MVIEPKPEDEVYPMMQNPETFQELNPSTADAANHAKPAFWDDAAHFETL